MLVLIPALIEETSLSWYLCDLDMVQGKSNIFGMFFRRKQYIAAGGWQKVYVKD